MGQRDRIADRPQAARRGAGQQHARGRAMLLEIADGAREQALGGWDEHDARGNGEAGGEQHQAKIAKQRLAAAGGQPGFNSLGEEGAEKAVRGARYQHENVEQGKAHGDPPRPHSGDARGIGPARRSG